MKPVTDTRLRFALDGVADTLVDVVGHPSPVLAGTPLRPANLISTSTGMVSSIVVHRSFTLRVRSGDRRSQVALFVLCAASRLWVVQPVAVSMADELFGDPAAVVAVAGPKLVGLALGSVWNYTLYREVVFRRQETAR